MSKKEIKSITQDDNSEELESATPSEDVMSDQDLSEEDNKEVEGLMQIALLCNDSAIQNFNLSYEDLKFIGSPTEQMLGQPQRLWLISRG